MALHTPHLRSNLISVSKLEFKGAKVSYEGPMVVVYDSKGRKVLTAKRGDGLYVANITGLVVNSVWSKAGIISFEIWHRQLAHAPVDVISRMARDKLVGGLSPSGEAKLDALCEDCIFGKHTTHPFHNKPFVEEKALDCALIHQYLGASKC